MMIMMQSIGRGDVIHNRRCVDDDRVVGSKEEMWVQRQQRQRNYGPEDDDTRSRTENLEKNNEISVM